MISYYCKYAFRVLNRSPSSTSSRSRERLYDEAVLQTLTVLWEASDRICGKQKAIIPVLVGPGRGTPSALGCRLGNQTKRAGTHLRRLDEAALGRTFRNPRAGGAAQIDSRDPATVGRDIVRPNHGCQQTAISRIFSRASPLCGSTNIARPRAENCDEYIT